MTRPGITPDHHTIELAGQVSPQLGRSLERFVKSSTSLESVQAALGHRAVAAIHLLSSQKAHFDEPQQIDRGFYGEGDGVVLGRYDHELDKLSTNKIRINPRNDKMGLQINTHGDARVWLTLEPTSQEQSVIVQPPLFEKGESDPNLGMYFVIPKSVFIGKAEAIVALHSLHVRLESQETAEQSERQRIMEARLNREVAKARQPHLTAEQLDSLHPSPARTPLEYYITHLRALHTKRKSIPPFSGNLSVPNVPERDAA